VVLTPVGARYFTFSTLRPGISIPPSLPYNWSCGSFPGIKREGLRVDYPIPIRAEVQNIPSLCARIACYAETFTFIVYMQVWIPINLAAIKSSTHHILGSLSEVSSVNVGTLIEKKNKCYIHGSVHHSNCSKINTNKMTLMDYPLFHG